MKETLVSKKKNKKERAGRGGAYKRNFKKVGTYRHRHGASFRVTCGGGWGVRAYRSRRGASPVVGGD